jgi:CDP-diacylglycerol--serine O-phosphatidyltransferase
MKLKYLAPNMFTITSLLAGFMGLNFAANGNYDTACWMVIISVFCDGFDGKVARMLNAQSRFGAEMDSFVDFFSFGVVPAFIAYRTSLHHFQAFGIFASFAFIFAGMFRLIRFNIGNTDLDTKSDFEGLPIPAASGLITTFILLNYKVYGTFKHDAILLLMTCIGAFLMVSKIEYVCSDRVTKNSHRKIQRAMLFLVVLSMFVIKSYAFFGIAYGYAIYGLFRYLRDVTHHDTEESIQLK